MTHLPFSVQEKSHRCCKGCQCRMSEFAGVFSWKTYLVHFSRPKECSFLLEQWSSTKDLQRTEV